MKMNCPDCGAEMNHFANKLVYGGEHDDPDAELGGVIEEAHACPECGNIVTRRKDGESEAT